MSHTSPTTIVGAGLAGLLAAHFWRTAEVIEAAPGPNPAHRALLRFRSDAFAKVVGIDFRPVTVRKGLWSRNALRAPDIQLANLYASKVLPLGAVANRSIWNLDAAQRWVAPEDLYERMVEGLGARIRWGRLWEPSALRSAASPPVVSTAPLDLTLRAVFGGPEAEALKLERSPIFVQRYRVRNADVHQTVYFPDPDTAIYRASITGDLLIVEMTAAPPELMQGRAIDALEGIFGLPVGALTPLDEGATEQRFGKILPFDDALRRRLIYQLSTEKQVYSLGRFACWRNILLDDVVDDLSVINRLLRVNDSYATRKDAFK